MSDAADNKVRATREARGLSQSALAAAAKISRQAVGAIEAGSYRPSVDVGLAISSVLGVSVEELFGSGQEPAAVPALSREAPVRGALLAARVGDRIVYAAASDALADAGWPQANALLEGGQPRLLPGGDLDGFIVVGCDPALGSVAAMLPSSGPRHLIALSGSTGTALAAMRDGRAHGALVHNRADRLPTPPPGVLRLHLARWRVGIASRGKRPRSISELCERRARVVQRDAGASSQKAFLAAVAAVGGEPPPGPVVPGHMEAARRVVDGALAGVTMEPAALRFELAFDGLEEHVAELWIDARWRTHPAVGALGNVLRSAVCTSRLGLIDGYDVTHCGEQRGA